MESTGQLKDVYFDGASASCGQARTEDEARTLAWAKLPDDIKEEMGGKEKLSLMAEFETSWIF